MHAAEVGYESLPRKQLHYPSSHIIAIRLGGGTDDEQIAKHVRLETTPSLPQARATRESEEHYGCLTEWVKQLVGKSSEHTFL